MQHESSGHQYVAGGGRGGGGGGGGGVGQDHVNSDFAASMVQDFYCYWRKRRLFF